MGFGVGVGGWGLEVWGLEFGVWGLGLGIWGFGFRVEGSRFRGLGLGVSFEGFEFRVQGVGVTHAAAMKSHEVNEPPCSEKLTPSAKVDSVSSQGYLDYKKTHPPRTLPQAYA